MNRRWRSLLFAPANRPELVAKLPRSYPDVVALDLEDAVPADHKVGARPMARAGAETLLGMQGGPRIVIRVNATRTEWFERDVHDALVDGLAAVIVPKLESVDEVHYVRETLAAAGFDGLGILAGIETARGLADAREILAQPGIAATYFGAEDFTADMGGVRRDDNLEVLYGRSALSLAARLGGVPALDIVVADFHDDARLQREASEARALGYSGKLCIHPAQVPLANAAFIPSPDEIARSRRLLSAYEAASAEGRAAIAFEGQMVDEPLAARARAVLHSADD
jgi:citrate lyase subunit beta/citryl-CoA lyase